MELIQEYKHILIYKMNSNNKFRLMIDTPDGMISNQKEFNSIEEAIFEIDNLSK